MARLFEPCKNDDMEPLLKLRNAIIQQAAKDYRKALKILSKNPRNEVYRQEKEEIETFFKSDCNSMLLKNESGVYILDKLNKEIAL